MKRRFRGIWLLALACSPVLLYAADNDSNGQTAISERPKSLLIIPWKEAPQEAAIEPPWKKHRLPESRDIRERETLQRRLNYHRHFSRSP